MIPRRELEALLAGRLPLWPYLEEARRVREAAFGREVETCAILNAKSGRCPSDCAFCAQSVHHRAKAPVYPLLSSEEILSAAEEAARAGIDRFSLVTSGIRLSAREFERLLEVIRKIRKRWPGLKLCASLGQLGRSELLALKEAGLSRYHHNLETAESL